MNKKKILIVVLLTISFCVIGYFRFIGFSGAPMFTESIKVEIKSGEGINLTEETSDLEIKNITKSEVTYLERRGNKLVLSLRLEGIPGREKFALLPVDWGKYETFDYWDLNARRSDIKESLKRYLIINGIEEHNIDNIDLSSFNARYNFKD